MARKSVDLFQSYETLESVCQITAERKMVGRSKNIDLMNRNEMRTEEEEEEVRKNKLKKKNE